MKRNTIVVCMLLAFFAFSLGCRKGARIEEMHGVASTQISMRQMEKAIKIGCIQSGWTPKNIDANTIEASIVVRGKHTVVVSIPYSAGAYSIKYKSSINMNYELKKEGGYSIHPNYNKWVTRLQQYIERNISISSL